MGYLQMTRNVESIFGAVVTAPHQIPYTYTATGGETFISLPFHPVTGIVTINGGMQVPLDNFEIDGNTLNLGRALSKGDVVFCLFDKILSPEDYKTGIRIYKFQAIGGETEFTPDYTSYGVQSLYIGGEYKTPEIEYSYDRTTGKVSLQTALTAGVWVVAEMSVKQPNISPLFDRSIQEIARAANVKDSEVILSTDTTQYLNGKKVIYDVAAQKAYGLPTLPTNVYISSITDGKLVYNPGSVTVDLLPIPDATLDAFKEELHGNTGINLVGGGLHAGSSEDVDPYTTIVVNGEVYTLEPGLTGLADGFSVNSGNLYMTLSGNTYKYVTNGKYLSWPGSYLVSLPDAKQSMETIMAFGKGIDLCGHAVKVSSLDVTANIKNGELIAIGDIGSFIVINNATVDLVKVNCNGKAIRRAVHLKIGSVNPQFVRSEVFGSTGATNANGVFVDANSVKNFLVSDITVRNLTSVANGSQGDAVGPCRGVIVGSALDPVPTAATVSYGLIENVRIRDLAPFEDCDGVVVQIYDASSTMLSSKNIIVDGVYTYNVLKRAVKIQSNDVTVKNVNAVCDSPSDAMYAIVSLYGDNCLAENITGRGKISNGIDCAYGFNHVHNLYLKTERTGSDTLSGINAGLLINSGQVSAKNIHSEGTEYVVAVREALGNTPYVKVDGIFGQGYSGVVRFQIRAANSIGSVYLSNISATSSANNKGSVSVDFTSGSLNYLNITGVKRLSQPYTGPDIHLAGQVTEAYFSDCVFNSGSSTVGINMTTGKLFVNGVASNKTVAVIANQTTGAYIANVNGVVKLENTTNTTLITANPPTTVGTNTGLKQVTYS